MATSATSIKEGLVDSAELIAKAEEKAAVAADWEQLAQRATRHQLLSLPAVASAMAYSAEIEAAACERWADEAAAAEDVLLERALRRLVEQLRGAVTHAQAVVREAEGFAQSEGP